METIVMVEIKIRVQVLSDLENVSRKAAEMFVNISRSCIASQGKFSAAISGGSTPKRLYTLLSSDRYRDEVNWPTVHFFWADERCVPKEHEESNFKTAYDTLLSRVPIPDENIHRIEGEENPDKGARDYEEDVMQFFGMSGVPIFDLVILGMGEDGHTASLFPGSKSLEETIRLAVPVYLEKPYRNRITLTLPVLNNASQIIFLVAGSSKADVLSEILGDGHKKGQYPAGLINPTQGHLIWLIDREASWKLKGGKS
jgi:6-phosphogluconolactonase